MNIYDFDNTIYNGESLYDFFLFCLKKDLLLIRFFPQTLIALISYKLNLINVDKIEKNLNKIIQKTSHTLDFEKLVKEFWQKNINKIKPQFKNMLTEKDIIITGCPDILFNEIKDTLNVKNSICSQFDIKNNKLNLLCIGKNKVKRYNELYPDIPINKLYTDSLVDQPLMDLAKEVYLVKKDKITKIKSK